MIKKLSQSIRNYKTVSIVTPLFVIIEVVFEILIPVLMAKLIDEGISGDDQNALTSIGMILIVFVLLGLVAGIFSGTLSAKASAGFAKNLRKDMYYHIQDYSFANIDRFSSSSLVTRLTTDVTNVQNAYLMIIRVAVRAPFMLVFSLAAALYVNTQLSLIFLAAIPILGIGLYLIVSKSHKPFERVFRIYDKLNSVVQENLSGIRVVKSFVREQHEEEKFESVSTDIYRNFTKAEKIVAYNMPLMQFVIYACMLLLCWFGARIIVTSNATSMTTGELSSMIAYAMQILNCLMMVSMVFTMINMARASAQRIVEVLDENSSLSNPEHPIKELQDGDIVFENVSFGYNDTHCLHNINLHIPSGTTLGIVGGTGSGKSTLVQLIPRLYETLEGHVLVGGHDVREYDLYILRNEVAMVLQKNELFSGTIKENLRWGNKLAGDDQLVEACRLAQADSFIEAFPDGYSTHIEQGGTNVSGGQKQRLCIARALLKRPKILILDDSTSAVDTATEALIRSALEKSIPNTTKIIIAQRISSVEHAEQIIVMEDGYINGMGTHEELLKTNKIYQEIDASQKKGETAHE